LSLDQKKKQYKIIVGQLKKELDQMKEEVAKDNQEPDEH